MEYTRLGDSGLQVSRITIGCMSWGDGGNDRPWLKDEAFAEQTIRSALDAGINFFDTANVYAAGTSEEYTGRSLWKHADREDVVLATKVFNRMRPGPERRGALAQGDPAGDRRQPRPARHGLRRPLPDPSLRPGDPGGGDDGGAARRREVGEGALHRGVVDVRLAVRHDAARRGAERVDEVRLHAEPLQPHLPRGGARDAPALPRPGRRRHPVEPARARPADAAVGHPDGALRDRRVRPVALPRRGRGRRATR